MILRVIYLKVNCIEDEPVAEDINQKQRDVAVDILVDLVLVGAVCIDRKGDKAVVNCDEGEQVSAVDVEIVKQGKIVLDRRDNVILDSFYSRAVELDFTVSACNGASVRAIIVRIDEVIGFH